MSDFFKLHQRQDVVLYNQDGERRIGVVLGYEENAYVLKPLAAVKTLVDNTIISVLESSIEQKLGTLDFDALKEAEPSFDFGTWAQIEEF